MIRHVVMWKLKENAMEMAKPALVLEAKRRLETLPALISEIKYFQVGLNKVESERSRDMVLVSDFEDLAALGRYMAHREHLVVVEFLKQAVDESRVVDFEFA